MRSSDAFSRSMKGDLDLYDCGFRNLANPRGTETTSCQGLNTPIDNRLAALTFCVHRIPLRRTYSR
jgi:hypothetical protein